VANVFSIADTDWFRFLVAPGQLTLTATAQSFGSLELRLFAPDGTTLVGSDVNGGSGSINYNVPTTGFYYAEVTGFAGATGGYTLSVSGVVPDDHGNNAATATAIVVPSTSTGTISLSGDSDYFSFAAIAGRQYRFETLGGGTLSNTTLTLYGTNGTTQIAFNDNSIGLLSLITWTVPTSGTYYIAVRGFGSSTGTYTLSVTQVGGASAVYAGADESFQPDTPLEAAFASFAEESHVKRVRPRFAPEVRG
jgi:serralysin